MVILEKTIFHPRIGEVKYIKKTGSRNIRLTLHHRKGIIVSLPFFVSYSKAQAFVEANLPWIEKSMARERKRRELARRAGRIIEIPKDPRAVAGIRKAARAQLIPRLDELAAKHGFTYNKAFIKNNTSNWGSCSSLNNINLNLRLIYLPQELSDYVILHELCHLIHRNHGEEFHLLLDRLLNHQEKRLARELKSYFPR